MPLYTAKFRFYQELNDFLPYEYKKKSLQYKFKGNPSVKDAIEAMGIPHTEVDLIIANSKSVDFSYQLHDRDFIAVYPEFESIDISSVQKLRQKPLRKTKFILDVQLGKLAKNLRILGFDTLYKNNYKNKQIIKISRQEHRIILTRNKALLKNKTVTHGYWIRNTYPELQLREIIKRFDLKTQIKPFTRCLMCNGKIVTVKKNEIDEYLLPKTKKNFNEFFQCSKCKKIYWKGSHFKKMKNKINLIINQQSLWNG
ncbi:MAG: Mut7-C RNAse domain-containing protein [bacterium]